MLGPIFVREWLTLPRRTWHYVLRTLYLVLLWVLALTAWQAAVGWEQPATLGDTARFGWLLFHVLSYVQLVLLMFFAALSAASTISQEKDRRTFVLLLVTDLRNYEIVLGKLLGSLLQIVLFLAGMVPVLLMLLLLGGVSGEQVVQATVVLATTALAAGSLGGLVALWREKTFQALALTVLFLVLYICLVQALTLVPWLLGLVALQPPATETITMWQTWLQPFLALESVLDPPLEQAVVAPAYGFAIAMLVLSGVLNLLGILRLRVWNPSGEPIIQREAPEGQQPIDRARAHAAPGPVRKVWENPILWREIATRAYGRRPLLVKSAYFLVVVLVGYYALGPAQSGEWAAARGLVPIGILSLILVSAQAVTAITSERDVGSLDLLLVTDITPKEFIFGKLWGILYNTKEYLLPPLILAVIYAARGLLASPPRGHPQMLFGKNLEAFFCVAAGILIFFAFVMILGVHVGLGTSNSRAAVLKTLGTVFFLSVGTLICIYLIIINGRFEYQWLSFAGFILAGVGGLWWVLSGERPSHALWWASVACPVAVFYSVTNILIGKPLLQESTDPFIPFLVTGGAFGFTIAAMLVPLLGDFDVALGRTTGGGE